MVDDRKKSTVILLRKSIDDSINSLGGPIAKTINWHMDKRGVFTDPAQFDIETFSKNLEELIGPGAELILDEAAERLAEISKVPISLERNGPAVKRILRIMRVLGGNTEA